MSTDIRAEVEALTFDAFLPVIQDKYARMRTEIKKLMVGLDRTIELSITTMLGDGHVLLQDVPGAGKTTLAQAIAGTLLQGEYEFYQGTADMLPADLIGGMILDLETRKLKWEWAVVKPTTNILVADEINRTPPKTQSSQLSIMQERKLGQAGKLVSCADPFFVIATQNPIENEGTYPLAEAVKDRFAIMNEPGELTPAEEEFLLKRVAIYDRDPLKASGVKPVITPYDFVLMREFIRTRIVVSDEVISYIRRLVRATRPRCDEFRYMPAEHREALSLGAGRRGGIWLTALAKVRAALQGREHVLFEDVAYLASSVLAHRLTLRPGAEAEYSGQREQEIITDLLESVPTVGDYVPANEGSADEDEATATPAPSKGGLFGRVRRALGGR